MEEPVLEDGGQVDPDVTPDVSGETEPTVEPTEAPAWSGPSQEEWAALTGGLQELRQQFAPAPVEVAPPGIESYFPTDPDTGEASLTFEALERFVNDRADNLVQQRMGQFEPVLNQTVADRGEQLITQTFDKLAEHGDFDRGLARELAEGYASSGFAPDEAIKRGAQRARDFAQAQRQAGIDEYKTTLGNIGNAPREPGVNGAGVQLDGPPEGATTADKYKWVADNYVARQRLT